MNFLLFINKINTFNTNYFRGLPEYYPIVITGDFNSDPDSAVYELICKGELDYENRTKKTLTYLNSTDDGYKNGKELIPPNLRITGKYSYGNIN